MPEVCGWRGCRRPVRGNCELQQILRMVSALEVTEDPRERVSMRTTVMRIGFELSGVCPGCAEAIERSGVAAAIAGHKGGPHA